MVSKVLLALCAVLAITTAVPAGGWPPAGAGWPAAGNTNPWIPPWLSSAAWMPQWTPCTTIGSSCHDCTTKVVCTKIGGIQKACSDPTLPYCNDGECSATPSANCAVPAVPAAAAAGAA